MKIVRAASNVIGRVAYGAVSIALMAISFGMIVASLWELLTAIGEQRHIIHAFLNAVSLIVIAMAVFDVSKFLVEEEVIGTAEKESSLEQKARLMRFLIIITIAVSLESLVSIFAAARADIRLLMYPTFLLVADIFLIVSLGVYSKLTAD
jgi:hypothetical protein